MKSSDLRLLLSLSGGRRLFFASICAGLIWSLVVVLNGFLIAEIIVRIIGHKGDVSFSLSVLGALWIFRAAFQPSFERWTLNRAIEMKRELRSRTTIQVKSYVTMPTGELATILTKGLNSLDIYLGRFIPQIISATIVPSAVIIFLFFQDKLSGFIALVTLPMIPIFGALIGRYSADSVARKWRSLGMLSRYFEDSLRGFATLKIFGRGTTQSTRIRAMGNKYTSETMQVLRISFLSAFALELIATLSVAVIAVSIGLRLVGGSIDFKSSLVILILAPDVYFPVRNAASLFHASEDGTQALRQMSVLSGEASKPDLTTREVISSEIIGLSWQDWTLEREGGEKVLFPKGEIHSGEMVFVTGESGIGKTTFSQNFLGTLFDAKVMIFTLDGPQPLTPSISQSWQRNVGWVPQNPQLASGTVRDQFRLLDPAIADIDIEIALDRCGLHAFELPNGLDTRVGRGGEQGHSASGGQIRRIAMARALLRSPSVIIADEPTADLDPDSSLTIMDALRSAQRAGAMVICISHRAELILPGDKLICAERVQK